MSEWNAARTEYWENKGMKQQLCFEQSCDIIFFGGKQKWCAQCRRSHNRKKQNNLQSQICLERGCGFSCSECDECDCTHGKQPLMWSDVCTDCAYKIERLAQERLEKEKAKEIAERSKREANEARREARLALAKLALAKLAKKRCAESEGLKLLGWTD